MSSDHQTVERLFEAASDIADPKARADYLDRSCGGDLQLRQRVEALLQAGVESKRDQFLEQPVAVVPAGAIAEATTKVPEAEKIGDRIGRYRLLQKIGEGGCGVVYMAEQEQPLRRRVALKVIKLGMDTKSVIARFEAERQALALMDHPNIAGVLDAGATDTGRPYFVMELVRGVRITDYCDQNNLPTAARLDLFTKVCHSIQHAHQKGIIHRDIKPSNILVTLQDGVPVPKVIDFGIAKATADQRLTDKTLFTAFDQFIGTPAYMSPEQAGMRDLDIDTRSDIYSLGVLLYELLVGNTPFDAVELQKIGFDAMRRTILEKEPARPSTRLSTMLGADLSTAAQRRQTVASKLVHLVRGDLDWIVMKALEKDRERRYETANSLAADVQRHMGNESVEARPPSRLYRFQKAVRRNKLAFTAASGVVVALVIGLSVSTWFFLKERRARNQIRQRQALEQIQVKRLITRSPGWSEETWSLAKEAMRIGGGLNTADIRNQAAATLAGLDAREQFFTNFEASSVLFDQEGKRLLMGGLGSGGKLWGSTTDSVCTPSKAGVGPVAFGADGTPLQLLYESNRHALVLEGVVNSKSTVEWRIPAQIGPATLRKDAPKLAAMTLDGSSILAVFALSDDREILTLFRSNDVRSLDIFAKPLSAVSISSDGELGAAAETDGNVTVWSMSDGRRLATLRTPRTTVLCLAFKRANQVFESRRQGTNELGILATGDSEGNVSIWDVNSEAVRAHYRYGHYGVLAVAFSPDGTTIASGGSGPVDLWDLATERLHLKITCGSPITALAFAPDGMRLAASSGWSSGPARVSVWALRFGRGIHSLHGLSGQITKVCFSADGRTLAALSQGWKVGVWDTTSDQLLRIIETPRGETADNAALALSPDGGRLVFAAFKTAKMWEIKSGVELASWDLPPGLVDTLGFPDQGHPLLFRVETLDGKLEPFSNAHPTHHPRVCRIRELLSSNLARPIAEIRDFNWHVFNAVAPSDARYFLVHGLHEEAGVKTAMVKAFDGFNGKALWSMPSAITNGWGVFAADPSGRSFIFQTNNSPRSVLARSSSGTVAKTLPWPATAFSSVAGLFAVRGLPSVHGRGYSIFHDTQEAPLVTLGFDEEAPSYAQFDLSGNQVAWGNTDGTVTVYNLKEIDGRLGTAELQW